MAPKKTPARGEDGGALKKRKPKVSAAADADGGDEDVDEEEDDDEQDEDEDEDDEDEVDEASDDAGSVISGSGGGSDEEEEQGDEEDDVDDEEDEEEEDDDESLSDGEGGGKKKTKKGAKGTKGAKGGAKGKRKRTEEAVDDAESVGSFDAYQQTWTAEDDGDDELEPEEMEQRLANKYRRVQEVRGRSIVHMHPELTPISHEEMQALSRVVRNERGEVADPLHRRSAALLSKYEFTAVTSKRAEQLDRDDEPLVQDVPPGMVSSIAIAHYEFQKGALNDIFIIQRPFPDGSSEYWRLGDLEYV